MTSSILEVKGLEVDFTTEAGTLTAVHGSSFSVPHGKTLGIVGESGCGKSVTAFSIMRLIPNPPGFIRAGSIVYQGRDLLQLSLDEIRRVRGKEIAMIPQEPMTALNPVYTIGTQVEEIYRIHFDFSAQEIRNRAIESLQQVGIPSPEKRIFDYPHQLSGGMRQRVMIAMALACSPQILIADEPTTALDVTIQAQILDLMNKLKSELKASIIFITHDLGVVAEMCDEVIVMYAGQIIEKSAISELYKQPLHPYTRGLLDSIPKRGVSKSRHLPTIEGMVPDLLTPPPGCRFADRCFKREDHCHIQEPVLKEVGGGRTVACHHPLV